MDLEDDILFLWENDPSLDFCDISESYNGKQKSESLSSKGETFFKQIDEDLDYAFALSLQEQYNDEGKENTDINLKKSVSKTAIPLSIVDEQWELIDPHPDIHALFLEYDDKFFFGKLKGVEVRWSPRMTLCAGICCYEGRGGLCSVRLSVPLLKLRPRRDLVETLLHEMIHAYLFVTDNNKDRDGHGPEFLSHMNRINRETGTRISVYHSFHDEVDLYRQHWWKCDGPCQKRRPFFGLVKRAMNRAPGPRDNWWAVHQSSCGGKFTKIKEPDDYKKKSSKRKLPSVSESKKSDIRNFLKNTASSGDASTSAKSSKIFDLKSITSDVCEENVATVSHSKMPAKKNFIPFQCIGIKLGGPSTSSSTAADRVPAWIKKDLSVVSDSTEKILDVSCSKIPKTSQLPISSIDKDLQKGQFISSNLGHTSKKLLQSPMEKFLTSSTVAGSSAFKNERNNEPFVYEKKKQYSATKVSCPVCFILVKEEDINSHLDECINS